MAERYTKLSSLERNLYTPGSPVVILAGSLLRDNETSKVLGQFKFKNITDKIIKALVIKVDAYDVSGKELPGVAEYQYLDLFAQRDAEFGQKSAVLLPENITRSVTVRCVSAVFADDTMWTAPEAAVWTPLPYQQTVADAIGADLAEQYQRDTSLRSRLIPLEYEDVWFCSCGTINWKNETECHDCCNGRSVLLDALDIEGLRERKAAYDKEEAEKAAERAAKQTAEEEARAAEMAARKKELCKKAKKAAKIAGIVAAVAVLIVAAVFLIKNVIIPNNQYNDAIALMEAGQYSEAIAAFEALDGYKDSAEQITECNYNEALALMEAGKYTEAVEAFSALNGYKDSASKIADCNTAILGEKYNEALALMNDGRYVEAVALFTSLNGYGDSNTKIYECNTARFNEIYNEAIAIKNAGKYSEAAGAFRSIRRMPVAPTLRDEASYQLALCLIEQNLYEEARAVLLEIESHTEASALLEKFHYRITSLTKLSDRFSDSSTWTFEYEFDESGNLECLTLTEGDWITEEISTAVYTYEDGVVSSCEYTDTVWHWDRDLNFSIVDREWVFEYSIEGTVFHSDCTVTQPGERRTDSDSYMILAAADGSAQLKLKGDDSYVERINDIGFYEVIPVSSDCEYELEWTLFFDDNHLDGLDYLLLYVERMQ